MAIKNLRDIVPAEFYRGDQSHPTAETVEELITQLQRLPGDMPVSADYEEGCALVVFNINADDAHLCIVDRDY